MKVDVNKNGGDDRAEAEPKGSSNTANAHHMRPVLLSDHLSNELVDGVVRSAETDEHSPSDQQLHLVRDLGQRIQHASKLHACDLKMHAT